MLPKYILSIILFLSVIISYAQGNPDSIYINNQIINNYFIYSFKLSDSDSVKAAIYNSWGSLVIKQDLWYEPGSYEVMLPFDEKEGVYVYRINFKSGKEYAGALKNIITSTIISETKKFKVYPNPFKENLFIQSCNNCSVELYDQMGISMYKAIDLNSFVEINTTTLSSGLYFIKIIQGQRIEVFPIVK